ncbi:MAG: type II toxin-antitoxin system RelE/ParE family toxin [Bacteroidia bacterium]
MLDFLDQLEEKARDKILFNVDKVKIENDPKRFKRLNKDIGEFRTLYAKKQYRLFAFWDKSDNQVTIVVATHGIIKKTQKTPRKEIDKALLMMKEYFNAKK